MVYLPFSDAKVTSISHGFPAGSPSRGEDVAVHVLDINQRSLPTPFLFWSCVYFCLCGPYNCISFHKFSRQFSTFSLCSPRLISALLILSTIILSIYKSLPSPDIIRRSKTHKRLKERILIERNRTKRANFRGSPLRPINKCSFNLLCVLDLFSELWQSTLFQIFFKSVGVLTGLRTPATFLPISH